MEIGLTGRYWAVTWVKIPSMPAKTLSGPSLRFIAAPVEKPQLDIPADPARLNMRPGVKVTPARKSLYLATVLPIRVE